MEGFSQKWGAGLSHTGVHRQHWVATQPALIQASGVLAQQAWSPGDWGAPRGHVRPAGTRAHKYLGKLPAVWGLGWGAFGRNGTAVGGPGSWHWGLAFCVAPSPEPVLAVSCLSSTWLHSRCLEHECTPPPTSGTLADIYAPGPINPAAHPSREEPSQSSCLGMSTGLRVL